MRATTTKMVGSQPGARGVARPRTKKVDLTDPRGQLGAYLRNWFDRHPDVKREAFAESLGVSVRAVSKWCEGAAAPDLLKLDALAKKLGLADWSKLARAAVKFAEPQE